MNDAGFALPGQQPEPRTDRSGATVGDQPDQPAAAAPCSQHQGCIARFDGPGRQGTENARAVGFAELPKNAVAPARRGARPHCADRVRSAEKWLPSGRSQPQTRLSVLAACSVILVFR